MYRRVKTISTKSTDKTTGKIARIVTTMKKLLYILNWSTYCLRLYC